MYMYEYDKNTILISWIYCMIFYSNWPFTRIKNETIFISLYSIYVLEQVIFICLNINIKILFNWIWIYKEN